MCGGDKLGHVAVVTGRDGCGPLKWAVACACCTVKRSGQIGPSLILILGVLLAVCTVADKI